jgi:hypothetical protein
MVLKAILLVSVVVGLALFLKGHENIGISVVIAGYVLFIVVRIVSKRKGAAAPAEEEPEEQAGEPPAAPDSWAGLREKALEALNRRLRGQKIVVSSFFQPAHAKFPVLAKVQCDLSGSASELALKTDFEILKLGLSAQETANLLGVSSLRSQA